MKRFFSWQIITIIIASILLAFFDTPAGVQQKIFPWTPDWFAKQKIHLGLDLQGGSQLDYKIDLRKVPEAQHEEIVNGVMEVIEKRVNGLGVSEPNIYLSKVADEQHIVVELAEVKDLEEAKKTVGKTIQLEFKEKKDQPDPNEEKQQRAYAETLLKKIQEKNGSDFGLIAQEETQASPEKVRYEEAKDYQFTGELDAKFKDAVGKLKAGEVYGKLIDVANEFVLNAEGQVEQTSGVYLIKLIDKKEEVRFPKEVDASHVLIAYKGAKSAAPEVTRSEAEAKKLAKEIAEKAKKGEDFAKLAQESSDDTASKTKGGTLEGAVNKDASYVTSFKNATLELEKAGDISDPVKSEFGFHIIKANAIRTDIKEEKVKLEKMFVSTMPDPWKETGLTGEHFMHAEVQYNEFFQPYIAIQFNEKGAKLFEEITEKNIGKPLAIFVGGNKISSPTVQAKIPGGSAVINGQFTNEEALTLARDLNTGAIPAPIILAGQHTIGSTLGQDALQKSIRAGLYGLLLVAIFMIGYYRLPGLIATAALAIYTILLLFIIKSELPLWFSLMISTVIFVALIYKILNSAEHKGEKFLSFVLTTVILFFLSSVLSNAVTLTLAGVAGVILSIGMAVDANILIFERMKEELHAGHSLPAAVENGFNRAWSSIRDSNFSSLITCAILFYFGSSLIRGFALNLAVGIVVSMFTAITITRTLLRTVIKTKLAEKVSLFAPAKKGEKKIYKFIEKSKIWFTISGGSTIIALIAILMFNVRLGMDFTGGTFMELQFKKPVTAEELKKTLGEIEEDLNKNTATPEEKVDLKTAQIVTTDEGLQQVKTKFISTQAHDALIQELKNRHEELIETRFETVGATIGDTMKQKALVALVVASLMILLYLAFAFRKIPKHVNPWRFGICAIIALIHDLFITFGFFVILGKFTGVEIDALFITALLTILGFSVHDTIVVFDRIREHLKNSESNQMIEIADRSLTETIGRSINTSLSTVLTLVALLIFGSASIFYFVLALVFGIVIGTYSSIFVASPLLVLWTMKKSRKTV